MTFEERAMRALLKKPMTAAQLAVRLGCPKIRAFRLIKKLFNDGLLWRVATHRAGERGPPAYVWGTFDPGEKFTGGAWRV